MKIAILGATGHIARNIYDHFAGRAELILFSRSLEKLEQFYSNSIGKPVLKKNGSFNNSSYDVIINATGITDGNILKSTPELIFKVTEQVDELILGNIERSPATKVFHLSSGAVYKDFSNPVSNTTSVYKNKTEDSKPEDYYGIAKAESEFRHRALKENFVVDLRIFAFFSKYIDLEKKYLISEMINSVKSGKKFITNSSNIVRDYVNSIDLAALIDCCLESKHLNEAYDVYSAAPVTKNGLLDFFKDKYGLSYEVNDDIAADSATGFKEYYYSIYHKAGQIGYKPKYNSLETIQSTADILLGTKG